MKPGERIGPYQIVQVLGKGAMGEVYLGRLPSGHEHAVKVLGAAYMFDDEAVGRFEREMQVLAQVDGHPSITRVHSAGRLDSGRPYYAMEYVPGKSLRSALRNLDLEEMLEVIEALAGALAFAHRHGIVHRDVKPGNVLLGNDGSVKLADFGLVSAAGGAHQKLTMTGDMVGTPAYMAPEQARVELGETGPWSDVWGLGAVLYEAITGSPPYLAETSVEVYTKLIEGDEIAPPSAFRPDLDPRVEEIVMRCLQRDAAERYADGQELLDALRGPQEPEPEPTPPLLKGLSAGALGSALVCGVVLALAAFAGPERDPDGPAASASERPDRLAELISAESYVEALELFETLSPPDQQASLSSARAARRELAAARVESEDLVAAAEYLVEGDEHPQARLIAGLAGAEAPATAPALPPREAATLAAWQGKLEAARSALDQLGQEAEAEALAAAARLARYTPGLLPGDPAQKVSGRGGWAELARAELALAHGLPAVALREFSEARDEAGEAPRLAALAGVGVARTQLALGDVGAAAAALERPLRRRDSPLLERAEVLAWAALLAREPEAGAGLRAALGGADPGERARALCPAHPLLGGAELHRRLGADDPAWEHLPAARRNDGSAVLAEWALARRGLDGPEGLLLARAAHDARAALLGSDRELADESLEQLTLAGTWRPDSPLLALAKLEATLAESSEPTSQAAAAEHLAPALAKRQDDPGLLLAQARLAALQAARAGYLADLEQFPTTDTERAAAADEGEREDGRPPEAEEERAGGSEGEELSPEELARQERQAELDRRAARAHEAAARAYAAAREAAGRGSRLARRARLGRARQLLARLDRARALGDEALANECLTALRDELVPVLGQVDPAAVTGDRNRLCAAALADDPAAVEAAAVELAENWQGSVDRREALEVLEALSLLGAAGDEEAAAATLALGGDLPALAVLQLRKAEAEPDYREAELALARAERLAGWLPWAQLERAWRGLSQDSPLPFRVDATVGLALGRAVAEDPDWVPILVEACARADGQPLPELLAKSLDGAPLARALVTLIQAEREDSPRARQPYLVAALAAAGQASAADPDSGAAALLEGLALLALPDRGAAGDAARRALHRSSSLTPWSTAGLRLQLPQLGDYALWQAPVDALLARGFLANPTRIMPRAISSGDEGAREGRQLDRFHAYLVDAVGELDLSSSATELALAGALSAANMRSRTGRPVYWQLVLALRQDAGERRQDRTGQDMLLDQIAPSLAPGLRQSTLAAFWAGYGARGWRTRRDDRYGLAARAALDAQRLLSATREWRGLDPARWRAPFVRRRTPFADPVGSIASELLPAHQRLQLAWLDLHDPTRLIEVLGRTWRHFERPPHQELSSAADLRRPWSRSRRILCLPQDGRTQEDAADWASDHGEWRQAFLAALRAGAFDPAADISGELAEQGHDELLHWLVREEEAARPEVLAGYVRAVGRLGRGLFLAEEQEEEGASFLNLELAGELELQARLDAGQRPDGWIKRVRALAGQLDPEALPERDEWWAAVAWWNKARARALAGDTAGAERAAKLGLKEALDEVDWGRDRLRKWCKRDTLLDKRLRRKLIDLAR